MSQSGSSPKKVSLNTSTSSKKSAQSKRSPRRDISKIRPYDVNKIAAKVEESRSATIQLALPDSPVDVYLNGVLIKSNVSSLVQITKKSLPAGTSVHQLIVQDKDDRLKVKAEEILLTPGQATSLNMSGDLN